MKQPAKKFALCLENEGNETSLILGKVYRLLRDAQAAKDDFVRVVDESGEDYLFHRSQFAFVDFPQSVRKKSSLFNRPANTGMQMPAQRARRS